MYARYLKKQVGKEEFNYQFKEKVSLFGCNVGYIPWLLREKIKSKQSVSNKWHINVLDELNLHKEYHGSTLIIDLKPKQNKTNLSLYEVLDVWGFSYVVWSPILLRLNGLFIDADPNAVNRQNFSRKISDLDGPIYEFLYVDGAVENKEIIGKWVPPPASPTNAALLWPSTLKYFFHCIKSTNPEILEC